VVAPLPALAAAGVTGLNSLVVLRDGELGIDRAPAAAPSTADLVSLTTAAAAAVRRSSVSVSDQASPADRTNLVFFLRRGRENALLSELFS